MKLTNQIQAFTILEVIVTITLTSIIVLSSMLIYSSFMQVYNRNLETIQKNKDLILFNIQLNKDFKYSEKVTSVNDELILKQSDNSTISYQFVEKYIIRNAKEFADTHYVEHKDINYTYQNNLINGIIFTIITPNGNFTCYIHKEYDNSTIINSDYLNGN